MSRALGANAASRGLCTSLLALCLSASLPVRAQMPTVPDFDFQIDSLEKWDTTAEMLRKLAWAMHSVREAAGKDVRGRTVDDDWNELVMAPQAVGRLEELREKARAQAAAGDSAGVQSTLKEAEPLFMTQVSKAVLVMTYWNAEAAVSYHQIILRPWMDRAPEAQKKLLGDHIDATERSLVNVMDAGLTEANPERRTESVKLLIATKNVAGAYYNQQRRVLVDQLAKEPGAPALKSRKRESECPPPIAPIAGRGMPSLAPDNSAPEELYPPKSKSSGVEGAMVLEVSISETGCMEFAQVVGSSGVDELDEAALLWAERARFVPAEKDHKPAAGRMPFRMKFELRN